MKEQEDARTGGKAPPEKAEEAEQIPEPLHRLEKGGYWWIGTMDEDYLRQNAGLVMKIMGIIAACILLIGIIMALMENAMEILWIIVLTDAILMGIGWGISQLVVRSEYSRKQYHEIREDGLSIGQGKSRIYFPWERGQDRRGGNGAACFRLRPSGADEERKNRYARNLGRIRCEPAENRENDCAGAILGK